MLAKGDLVRWSEYYSCLTTVRNAGIGIVVEKRNSITCSVLRQSPYNDVFVFDDSHVYKIKH